MTEHRSELYALPGMCCPACKEEISGFTGKEMLQSEASKPSGLPIVPEHGTWSVCRGCGAITRFDMSSFPARLYEATNDDMLSLRPDLLGVLMAESGRARAKR